jgi:hypothetical protein
LIFLFLLTTKGSAGLVLFTTTVSAGVPVSRTMGSLNARDSVAGSVLPTILVFGAITRRRVMIAGREMVRRTRFTVRFVAIASSQIGLRTCAGV